MNFKNIVTSFVAGASLLAMVGSASALTNDINIYGASAQYNFYKAEAVNFLVNSQGCTVLGTSQTADNKNYIVQASCPGVANPLYFRSSSKASYDGPLAIQGNTTNPNRTTACSDPHQRMLMDPALVTSWGTASTPSAMPNTAVGCFTVTGGASDVQVTSFQQESHGALQGPNGYPGTWTDRNFKGAGAVTADGLTDCRPLVVPFAFWINNDVTKSSAQVANLTTGQARLFFSGQIGDWSDLGFDARPITVCLRHAGSGTHATIDLAVMRPAALIFQEDVEGAGSYNFYFNDGSADEMYCINNVAGAVGYSDADQSTSLYPNVHQVTYNGVAANKANISAGLYDFFTIQNLYTATPTSADMAALCSFMKNPANNTNAYYATSCELKYTKNTDASYLTINNNFGVCN